MDKHYYNRSTVWSSFRDKIDQIPKEDNDKFIDSIIKSLHTRVLLAIQKKARKSPTHDVVDRLPDHYWENNQIKIFLDERRFQGSRYYLTNSRIKEELSKRPHVDSRAQSKEKRKAKIKTGK